jgi:hypothetical protein
MGLWSGLEEGLRPHLIENATRKPRSLLIIENDAVFFAKPRRCLQRCLGCGAPLDRFPHRDHNRILNADTFDLRELARQSFGFGIVEVDRHSARPDKSIADQLR